MCLFTKSASENLTGEKINRNRIYKTCGYIMLICILLIFFIDKYFTDLESVLEEYNYVFWLEAIALWAFGFSWFVKGEGCFKDCD